MPYNVREFAEAVTLDFFNNYMTVEQFAEHNGIHPELAAALLDVCQWIHESPHPEA